MSIGLSLSMSMEPADIDFYAIDVETANSDQSSICSIGVCGFSGESLAMEWYSLVNPRDWFDDLNIEIHGITEEMVRDSPIFPECHPTLKDLLTGQLVVCHGAFDWKALRKACEKYNLSEIDCRWLNSHSVVRRTWRQFAKRGYALKNVCDFLNYEFQHHNALEDAKAAAHIVLKACEIKNITPAEWPTVVRKFFSRNIKREGNEDGHLHGERIVFTGELSCSREEAVDKAASVGCFVDVSVTKRTTILVVGDVGKYIKTTKQKQVEKFIKDGKDIKVINEQDFLELVKIEKK